jgi:hypothetical protein
MSIREFMGNCWIVASFLSGLLALDHLHAAQLPLSQHSVSQLPASQPPADLPAAPEPNAPGSNAPGSNSPGFNAPEQLPAPKLHGGYSFRFAERLAAEAKDRSQSNVFKIEVPVEALSQKSIDGQTTPSAMDTPGPQLPSSQLAESKSHELVTTAKLSFETPVGSKRSLPSQALESLLNQAWEPLVLQGEQTLHWLVRVEGNPIPLQIRIASQPPVEGQITTMVIQIEVAIPSEDGKGMVAITPESVSKILKRLRQYERWLRSSAEEWKAVGASRDWRDGREAVARARLMAAKQRETERSLQKWTAIEDLAEVIFQSARLEFTVE